MDIAGLSTAVEDRVLAQGTSSPVRLFDQANTYDDLHRLVKREEGELSGSTIGTYARFELFGRDLRGNVLTDKLNFDSVAPDGVWLLVELVVMVDEGLSLGWERRPLPTGPRTRAAAGVVFRGHRTGPRVQVGPVRGTTPSGASLRSMTTPNRPSPRGRTHRRLAAPRGQERGHDGCYVSCPATSTRTRPSKGHRDRRTSSLPRSRRCDCRDRAGRPRRSIPS